MKLMGNDGTIFLLSNGNGTICYPVDKTNRRVTLNKVYCVFTRMINEQMLDHNAILFAWHLFDKCERLQSATSVINVKGREDKYEPPKL